MSETKTEQEERKALAEKRRRNVYFAWLAWQQFEEERKKREKDANKEDKQTEHIAYFPGLPY